MSMCLVIEYNTSVNFASLYVCPRALVRKLLFKPHGFFEVITSPEYVVMESILRVLPRDGQRDIGTE